MQGDYRNAMWLSEQLLYLAARALYRSRLAHSEEMKSAVKSQETYDAYRATHIDRTILPAADKYGVPIAGRVVLDMGCNDGAISGGYLHHGAARVIGVDIDREAIERAQRLATPSLEFHVSSTTEIPLPAEHVDTIICYDVMEHVAQPAAMLAECHRVLRPGGKMLIGTWGWKHPFAPHLWQAMPVPWAHCLVSERTLFRVCRRVYNAPWYVPNMHDFDEHGQRKDKYRQEAIQPEYLNKLLVSDFERVFRESPFHAEVYPQAFGSRLARWSKVFLKVPWVREYITAYLWAVLTKPALPN